jgi:hypothetical protein
MIQFTEFADQLARPMKFGTRLFVPADVYLLITLLAAFALNVMLPPKCIIQKVNAVIV